VGLGAAGLLAGCENTTTPIGADAAGASSKLVVPKPVGPGGLPLPRPDNAVEWAITDDNQPIPSGRRPESGSLQVYNYSSYIDPGVVKRFEKRFDTSVKIATYDTPDEAVAKLSSGQVSFDVIIGLTGSNIVNLIAQQLLQPLNHSYLENFPKNTWPEIQDPFYDLGSRYTVPYTVWLDGIGWRNDKVSQDIAAMDVPWDIFWHSQAYRGKVGVLNDKRDALAMPMQRTGMHTGVPVDLNTEDPAILADSERQLSELYGICNVRTVITGYQTLPEGTSWLNQVWSGDVLNAVFFYLPKGTSPNVISFWGPEANGVFQNDFFCIGRTAKSPVLAHNFLNFMLDERIAYDNFVNFTGCSASRGSGSGTRPGRGSPPARDCGLMRSRWTWPLLSLPGVAWLSVFFLVAFYTVICVAFGNQDTLSQPVPFWNPLDWNVGYVQDVFRNILDGGQFFTVFVRTIEFVILAIGLSLLLGYPVAYFAARHSGRWKWLVLLALVVPFWINYLMRMLAWINLLSPDGWGTRVLHDVGIERLFVAMGLLSAEGGWLEGQPATVIIALVYGYIPFLILPLFAALDRIDQAQIEAARDLGASPRSAFLRVTLPLSMPGVFAGLVLVALPMFGDYYTPDLVSASPGTNMIGNQIDQFTRQGSQKVAGAALTLFLALFLFLLMLYYLRSTRRAGAQAVPGGK
jgi:ABC-type spermidine/putrescine transport system permease subunit I/spermidine/putrescine-binding protein